MNLLPNLPLHDLSAFLEAGGAEYSLSSGIGDFFRADLIHLVDGTGGTLNIACII